VGRLRFYALLGTISVLRDHSCLAQKNNKTLDSSVNDAPT
jgi:hypothetical protein